MEVSAKKLERDLVAHFLEEANRVILGKQEQIKLGLCTILAEGHLLIEDVPGVGKTTLVKLIAKALGLQTTRIQFTNDMLPADILGTSIFDSRSGQFSFHRGPIFSQMVIADELNRATPKTQSACLQAMEERRVSSDGMTYDLPQPFVVVATQNPREQVGTYPLPESQLDRFLMRIEIGYPDRQAEQSLLKGERRDVLLERLQPIMQASDILFLQREAQKVFAADVVINYIQNILDFSRQQFNDQRGLSPRAGLAMLRCAKSWAYLDGRNHILPDDVKAVAPAVMAHRLNRASDSQHHQGLERAYGILQSVRVD
jgi:MoxR-like ATPase